MLRVIYLLCSFLSPPLDVFAIGDPNQSTLLAVSVAGGVVLLVFLVTCFVVSGRYGQILHVFTRVEAVGYLTGAQRSGQQAQGARATSFMNKDGWVEHARAQTCGISIASGLCSLGDRGWACRSRYSMIDIYVTEGCVSLCEERGPFLLKVSLLLRSRLGDGEHVREEGS